MSGFGNFDAFMKYLLKEKKTQMVMIYFQVLVNLFSNVHKPLGS